MTIVCLNCNAVVKTEDPRKKFCNKVCRNRFNVRKNWAKQKNEKKVVVGVETLRELIKQIENKPKAPANSVAPEGVKLPEVVRLPETKKIDYEFNQEWRPPDVFVPFVKKNLGSLKAELDKLW